MPQATTSDALYNKQMNYLLNNVNWTPASSVFVALFTTAPALSGLGGTEVTQAGGTNYARVEIVSSTANQWNGPGSAPNLEYSNVNEILFPLPGADWGTIVAAGLYDSVIGGNNEFLFLATLTTPKIVANGDGAPKILVGQLRIARADCA